MDRSLRYWIQRPTVEYLADEIIESIANEVRLSNLGADVPIDVELLIERDFGIELVDIPGLKLRRDGPFWSELDSPEAYVSRGLDQICFDPGYPLNRLRFTLAHELAHVVLHGAYLESVSMSFLRGTGDVLSEWLRLISLIPNDKRRKMEIQANIFAANLLVPRGPFLDECTRFGMQKASISSRQGRSGEFEVALEAAEQALAEIFDVSRQVIQIRLKKLGLT